MKNPAVQRLMKNPSCLPDLLNPTAEKIFEKSRDNEDFVEVLCLVVDVDKDTVNRDVTEYFKVKISAEAFSGSSTTGETKPNQEFKNTTTSSTTENTQSTKPEAVKHNKAEEAFHKGNNLFVNEDYESALEQFDIAVTNDHKEPKYLLNRAACYLKLGDDTLALEDCNLCIKKGFTPFRVFALKIEACKSLKRADHVKETIEEALLLYPNDERLLNLQKGI